MDRPFLRDTSQRSACDSHVTRPLLISVLETFPTAFVGTCSGGFPRVGPGTTTLNRFITPMQRSCCRFLHNVWSAIRVPDCALDSPTSTLLKINKVFEADDNLCRWNAELLMSDQVLGPPCIYARRQVARVKSSANENEKLVLQSLCVAWRYDDSVSGMSYWRTGMLGVMAKSHGFVKASQWPTTPSRKHISGASMFSYTTYG